MVTQTFAWNSSGARKNHKFRGVWREFIRRAASQEFPLTVSATAGRPLAIEFPAVPIDHLREIAAEAPAPEIFPVGDDIAAIGTAPPLMALADAALEALVIGARGIGAILAIHVA